MTIVYILTILQTSYLSYYVHEYTQYISVGNFEEKIYAVRDPITKTILRIGSRYHFTHAQ